MRNLRTRKLMGVVSVVIVCLTVVAGALPKFPPPRFFPNSPHTLARSEGTASYHSFERDVALTTIEHHPHVTFLQQNTHSAMPRMRPPVHRAFVLNALKKFPHPPYGRPRRPFLTLRFAGNALLPPNLPDFERLFQVQGDLVHQPLFSDSTFMARSGLVSAAHVSSPSQSSLQVFRL